MPPANTKHLSFTRSQRVSYLTRCASHGCIVCGSGVNDDYLQVAVSQILGALYDIVEIVSKPSRLEVSVSLVSSCAYVSV
jgi:hypothetical protein